jgi:hypothetical protein
MQERVGAPAVVERRPAHDHESEGLVEFARCSVLLIDVNRERATKAILRMGDHQPSVALSAVRRFQK